MKKIISTLGIVVLLLMAIMPVLANAEENIEADAVNLEEGWKLSAGSVLWLSGLDAKIDTQNHNIDGDASFGDLVEKLKGAFAGEAIARYKKFSISLETANFYLQDDFATRLGGQRGLQFDMNWLQSTIGYRVYETPFLESGKVALEPMIGYRYYWNRLIIDRVGGGEGADRHKNWGDLIIGTRVIVDLNEKFSLFGSGTYGGFDIEDCSKYSWTLLEAFDWNFSKNKTLRVGYLWAGYKKENGNPSDANYLSVNATLSGPMASVIWHF